MTRRVCTTKCRDDSVMHRFKASIDDDLCKKAELFYYAFI